VLSTFTFIKFITVSGFGSGAKGRSFFKCAYLEISVTEMKWLTKNKNEEKPAEENRFDESME